MNALTSHDPQSAAALLGRPLPATARLLERIFAIGIDELLAPPKANDSEDPITEIRQRLHVSSRVDVATVELLREQLTAIRRLDRQLGAVVAHDEVLTKVEQVTDLFVYSTSGGVRDRLAGLLSELHCLAGWQALDLGNVTEAWRHYNEARAAALQASAAAYLALAEAGRAFVLLDAQETDSATRVLFEVTEKIASTCSPLLRAWLAAAYGETLAANGQRSQSMRAFDQADRVLPRNCTEPADPYVALDPVHLARWRGNALSQFAAPEAVDLLSSALDGLDPTFVRAETALRVDLATVYGALGESQEARRQALHAGQLADRIGSVRQRRRIRSLVTATEHADNQA